MAKASLPSSKTPPSPAPPAPSSAPVPSLPPPTTTVPGSTVADPRLTNELVKYIEKKVSESLGHGAPLDDLIVPFKNFDSTDKSHIANRTRLVSTEVQKYINEIIKEISKKPSVFRDALIDSDPGNALGYRSLKAASLKLQVAEILRSHEFDQRKEALCQNLTSQADGLLSAREIAYKRALNTMLVERQENIKKAANDYLEDPKNWRNLLKAAPVQDAGKAQGAKPQGAGRLDHVKNCILSFLKGEELLDVTGPQVTNAVKHVGSGLSKKSLLLLWRETLIDGSALTPQKPREAEAARKKGTNKAKTDIIEKIAAEKAKEWIDKREAVTPEHKNEAAWWGTRAPLPEFLVWGFIGCAVGAGLATGLAPALAGPVIMASGFLTGLGRLKFFHMTPPSVATPTTTSWEGAVSAAVDTKQDALVVLWGLKNWYETSPPHAMAARKKDFLAMVDESIDKIERTPDFQKQDWHELVKNLSKKRPKILSLFSS